MFAHLVVDLFVARIKLNANARSAQGSDGFLGILIRIRSNGRHNCLHRRQPHGHLARAALNHYADETLQRAENSAMKHDSIFA